MNTKSKTKKGDFLDQINGLFQYTKEEHFENEAYVLHMKIMSEVEKKMEEIGWKKKDLAKAVETSASYITQLFRGTRMLNLLMVAKFQEVFGGEFAIKWCDKGESLHFLSSIKNKKKENTTFVMTAITEENLKEAVMCA